jgi:N-acetylneuraminic acid mutarotase
MAAWISAVALAGLVVVGAAAGPSRAATTSWTDIASVPVPVQDNLVAANGTTVYSAFGTNFNGNTVADSPDLYSYDPAANTWTQQATAPATLEDPDGTFIDGRLYAAGGFSANAVSAKLYVYDAATNSWSIGASMKTPVAEAPAAVLNGDMYLVGGCTAIGCEGSSVVQVYDPATNSWSTAANYPIAVTQAACGAIDGQLYCAGGTTPPGQQTQNAYTYDPATNKWSAIASLPIEMSAPVYGPSGGQLLVAGGFTDSGFATTNQGFAYDPADNTWTALPEANYSVARAGGTTDSNGNLYQVGGTPSIANAPSVATAEVLPG